MFAEYIQAALKRAEYVALEDGTYMATVEGLRGVIAIGDTIEECRQDLIGVIEGWITLRLKMGDTVPPIDNVTIDVSTEPLAVV
jgi:predicted RNase H-like HicB family nuclease